MYCHERTRSLILLITGAAAATAAATTTTSSTTTTTTTTAAAAAVKNDFLRAVPQIRKSHYANLHQAAQAETNQEEHKLLACWREDLRAHVQREVDSLLDH